MKKAITWLVLIFLISSLLCGCNSKSESVGDDANPVLTWYIPGDKQADLSSVIEKVNEITTKKIGATIDIRFIDMGAFSQRMQMNMASKDSYDLCFTGYLNNYKSAVQNGSLYELDEFLDKSSDFKQTIPDYAWEDSKINGKIYAVPNLQIYAFSTCLAINKGLAEKYNLNTTAITKTTDIEPFLNQIKKTEPDIYPFCTSWGVASFRSLDEINHATGQALYEIASEGDKLVVKPGYEVGNTKEKAKILYDWYNKGFIRKDVASVMDDTQDIKAGKYAVTITNYKPGLEAEYKSQNGYDIVAVKVSPIIMTDGIAQGTMIGIGNNTKNPQKAFDFIKLINTDKDLYNLVCFGIEGKDYIKISENRVSQIENSGYNPNGTWKFGNQFNAYLLPGQDDDVWEQSARINEEAAPSVTKGFSFDNQKVKTQQTQASNVYKEYAVINNGTQNPDDYFNEYIKKINDAGLTQVIEECQHQIDEFARNKKN